MARLSKRDKRRAAMALAIGVPLLAALVIGGYVSFEHFKRGDDFAIYDDPRRTISLPNDAGEPRVMLRCEWGDECRSPDRGELVQPGESFEFKLYNDEDRTYLVADAQGRTLGCVTIPVANGVSPYTDSLSELGPCPPGTTSASG